MKKVLKGYWQSLSDSEKMVHKIAISFWVVYTIISFAPRFDNTKEYLYNVIRTIPKLSFWIFIIMSVCFVISAIKDRKFFKSRAFYVSWIVAFIFCIPHLPRLFGYSTTQIGDFYEADTYTETYYVYMSREPETVLDRKIYKLPAEIERRKDFQYTTDINEDYYGNTYGGHEVYNLVYHINYLYFPNGGYLSFNYDEAYDTPEYTEIQLDKELCVTDYYGDKYYITLTANKTHKPKK